MLGPAALYRLFGFSTGGMPGTVSIAAGLSTGAAGAAIAAAIGAGFGVPADCATRTMVAAAEHSKPKPRSTLSAGQIGSRQAQTRRARSGTAHKPR